MNNSLLDKIIWETAKFYPTSVAVALEDETANISFSDLKYRVVNLSLILNSVMNRGDFMDTDSVPMVSLMIDRDIGMIVAILSILNCGAAYVPVDPTFPPDRQSYIFSHSKSKCLIVDRDSYNKASRLGVQFPTVIMVDSKTGKADNDNICSNFSITGGHSFSTIRQSTNIAYVLYTSGSTGKPKGVMVSHQNVINIINWFARELNVKHGDKVLGLTTYCFDISVLEIFMPLMHGATLVLAKSSTQRDPYRIIEILNQHRINIFQATPTTYELLLATGWTGDERIRFLAGGEGFRSSMIPLMTNCFSLHNCFGPTETTIWSSAINLKGKVPEDRTTFPIGTPISKTSFYIGTVEGEGEGASPVEIAGAEQEGELFIGGEGVTRGYLHAPELTAKRFLPNPFRPPKIPSPEEEGGKEEDSYSTTVYRTGDIVKKLADGNYVFVRRMDDQVKVNGYRIELAEIEVAIAAYPPIEQTTVLVRNGQLVAYLLLKKDYHQQQQQSLSNSGLSHDSNTSDRRGKGEGKGIIISDLRDFIARSLTSYMIPKHFVTVEFFPQNPSGKLDKAALPDPIIQSEEVEYNDDDDEEEVGDVEEKQEKAPRPSRNDTSRGMSQKQSPSQYSTGDAYHLAQTTPTAAAATPATKSMVHFVCDLMHQVRGYRPRPQASFAAMALDSLGAVLFLRVLSDSLGGVRIPPSSVYGPGITVESFAEALALRLLKENPAILESKGIDPNKTTASGRDKNRQKVPVIDGAAAGGDIQDLETGSVESKDISTTTDADNTISKDNSCNNESINDSFHERILGNKDLLEGLRGMLMCLVLFEHFSSRRVIASASIGADTMIFIILSGFTNALQLRRNWTNEAGGGLFSAKGWQGGSFLLTRAVGMFPVLWLALVVNAVRWRGKDIMSSKAFQRQYSDGERAGCAVLYTLGMQSWARPLCNQLGPSDVLYASLLWNCFLIYALFRTVFNRWQYILLRNYSSNDIKNCNDNHNASSDNSGSVGRGSSAVRILIRVKEKAVLSIRRVLYVCSTSRPSSGCSCGLLTLGWIGFYLILFYASSFIVAKNPLSVIVYFFSGLSAASVFESLHWFMMHHTQDQYHPPSPEETPSTILPSPEDKRKLILAPSPSSSYVSGLTAISQRLLPDLLCASIAIMMTTLGHRSPATEMQLRNVVVPFFSILLVIAFFLQPPEVRKYGLARYLFESRPLRVIGYASYAIFLFQEVVLNYYFRMVYDGIAGNEVTLAPQYGYQNEWFAGRPAWLKPIGLLTIVGIGCGIQYYFQDSLVATLFSKYLMSRRVHSAVDI